MTSFSGYKSFRLQVFPMTSFPVTSFPVTSFSRHSGDAGILTAKQISWRAFAPWRRGLWRERSLAIASGSNTADLTFFLPAGSFISIELYSFAYLAISRVTPTANRGSSFVALGKDARELKHERLSASRLPNGFFLTLLEYKFLSLLLFAIALLEQLRGS